jgi:predicted nucleotidyltransferase
MDVSRPYTAVVPSVDGDVLVALAGTTSPLTGRQVARRVHWRSQRAVSATLDRLAEQGLVLRTQAGSSYHHVLNRQHIAAPAVEQLSLLRHELIKRLQVKLGSWGTAPVHASMFGSAARADGNTKSDIDLLVVRPDRVSEEDGEWRAQVDQLATAIHQWTGNHAGIVELTEPELNRLPKSRAPILADLRADGIDLVGTPLRKVLLNKADQ